MDTALPVRWKPMVRSLLGQRSCAEERVDLTALKHDWTFRRSRPDGVTWLVRLLRVSRGHVRPPASHALVPMAPRRRWIVYFLYLPDGRLGAAHRFTLERLRAGDAGLAIICATPQVGDVPASLHEYADALYWKALPGFDFSAYTLGLTEIVNRSPGADVLVLNDSVYGPFVSTDTLWENMAWDLTGFTASAQIENHIQSYAFFLRGWTQAKLRALRGVFPQNYAYDVYRDAVYGQETRFAAEASRTMSVGARWYADHVRANDPTLFAALPLLDVGFPFLKRSLLGRNAHIYGREAILDVLRTRGHPVADLRVPAA